jgi:hypothetical protein
MARRSVPPPKLKTPILTVGQKRRRIERLQKCITILEAFDLQKARKRQRFSNLKRPSTKRWLPCSATAHQHICGTMRPRRWTPARF